MIPWDFLRCIHQTRPMEMPLHLCDDLHLHSCCLLWKEFQSLQRLTAVQKLVGCCPKRWGNSVPWKAEDLANRQQQVSTFSHETLWDFIVLYFKLLFSSTSTSEKEFRTQEQNQDFSFLRGLPKNMHSKIKNPSIPKGWAQDSFADCIVDSKSEGARKGDMICLQGNKGWNRQQ